MANNFYNVHVEVNEASSFSVSLFIIDRKLSFTFIVQADKQLFA